AAAILGTMAAERVRREPLAALRVHVRSKVEREGRVCSRLGGAGGKISALGVAQAVADIMPASNRPGPVVGRLTAEAYGCKRPGSDRHRGRAAPRRLVAGGGSRHHRPGRLWCVRHTAGLRGRLFPMGALPLSFLFPTHRRPPSLLALFPGPAHPRRPARLSCYLLLLSQGVLSFVLLRSASLRGERTRRPSVPR